MFTTSSAPPAAWTAIGPFGLHASSQMLTPTRTPPITYSSSGSVAGREVALLVEHGVVRQEALAVDADHLAAAQTAAALWRSRPASTKPTIAAQRPVRAATFGERSPVVGHEAGLEHEVLGRVAGDGQLGEGGEVGAGRLGLLQGVEDALHVAVEVTHDGVDLAQRHAQAAHPASVRRAPGPPAVRIASASSQDTGHTVAPCSPPTSTS